MTYQEIKDKFLSGEISENEALELAKNRLNELEKIIKVKLRHRKMLKAEHLPYEVLKQIQQEEIDIGYTNIADVSVNDVNITDAVEHCFLEGGYSPYDEQSDLKIFESALKSKTNKNQLDILFTQYKNQKDKNLEKASETKSKILSYIQQKIDELESLKAKISDL